MEIRSVVPQGSLSKVQKPGAEDVRLRKACRDFESLLVSQMLSKMRATVQKSDLFGSGEQEEIFQGMLDQEIAGKIAQTGAMKIDDIMYQQISRK